MTNNKITALTTDDIKARLVSAVASYLRDSFAPPITKAA